MSIILSTKWILHSSCWLRNTVISDFFCHITQCLNNWTNAMNAGPGDENRLLSVAHDELGSRQHCHSPKYRSDCCIPVIQQPNLPRFHLSSSVCLSSKLMEVAFVFSLCKDSNLEKLSRNSHKPVCRTDPTDARRTLRPLRSRPDSEFSENLFQHTNWRSSLKSDIYWTMNTNLLLNFCCSWQFISTYRSQHYVLNDELTSTNSWSGIHVLPLSVDTYMMFGCPFTFWPLSVRNLIPT